MEGVGSRIYDIHILRDVCIKCADYRFLITLESVNNLESVLTSESFTHIYVDCIHILIVVFSIALKKVVVECNDFTHRNRERHQRTSYYISEIALGNINVDSLLSIVLSDKCSQESLLVGVQDSKKLIHDHACQHDLCCSL